MVTNATAAAILETQNTNAILNERQTTHGDFADNARVSQYMKEVVTHEIGWRQLTLVQREAIHMIILKLGRIVTGDPCVRDHWDDIAGYATLASTRVHEGNKA